MPAPTYMSAAELMRKVQLSRTAQSELMSAAFGLALKRRVAQAAQAERLALAVGGVPGGAPEPSQPLRAPLPAAPLGALSPRPAEKPGGFNSFWGEGKRGWRAELTSPKLRVAVTAELFGTFMFVATGLLSIMATSQVMGGLGGTTGPIDGTVASGDVALAAPYAGAAQVTVVGQPIGQGTDILYVTAGVTQSIARSMGVSMVFGLMICVLVFALGAISGGNLNPAVTLSLFLQGKMSLLRMACYIVAQCAGAIAGAYYARSLSPPIFKAVEGGRNELYSKVTNEWGGNLWSGLGAEICGTALLVFTVSAAADVGREQASKCVGLERRAHMRPPAPRARESAPPPHPPPPTSSTGTWARSRR